MAVYVYSCHLHLPHVLILLSCHLSLEMKVPLFLLYDYYAKCYGMDKQREQFNYTNFLPVYFNVC